LVKRSPFQAVSLLVFLTSLAGIPPLAGFFGKFAMFSTAMAATASGEKSGLAWLVGLGAIMSAVSLYYYLSVLKQAFVRDAAEDSVSSSASCLPVFHALSVAIPAVVLVLLGLFPSLLLAPISKAVMDSLGL
jgi:NADH-quinone oxidoreductase subunit N